MIDVQISWNFEIGLEMSKRILTAMVVVGDVDLPDIIYANFDSCASLAH